MLERLLSLVGQGGVHSYAELARQLDVSEELLEQMLQDLARMGYLRRVGTGCEGHCAGCPLSSACAVSRPGQVWALTERGAKDFCTQHLFFYLGGSGGMAEGQLRQKEGFDYSRSFGDGTNQAMLSDD